MTSIPQDWIYQQMLCVEEPLHPILPPLVQEFVSSVLLSTIASTRSTYQVFVLSVILQLV